MTTKAALAIVGADEEIPRLITGYKAKGCAADGGRMKPVLLIGPALVLASRVRGAVAGDGVPAVPRGMPTLDYLLTLGPYGALVCVGVCLLGWGVKITLQMELSVRDRGLISSTQTGIG